MRLLPHSRRDHTDIRARRRRGASLPGRLRYLATGHHLDQVAAYGPDDGFDGCFDSGGFASGAGLAAYRAPAHVEVRGDPVVVRPRARRARMRSSSWVKWSRLSARFARCSTTDRGARFARCSTTRLRNSTADALIRGLDFPLASLAARPPIHAERGGLAG
jgi:hypothetical protein